MTYLRDAIAYVQALIKAKVSSFSISFPNLESK